MSEDAPTETLPAATDAGRPPGTQLTGFAAGISGAALLTAGVWGLHVLTPSGGAVGSVGWVVLLLAAFTALGKGITLLRRALAPVTATLSASAAGISAPVRATAGIVIGAAGIWWVMRGHAATWWAQTTGTGTGTGWTLLVALVQVAIIAVAGALLFGGAKTLATLIFANSGTRHRDNNTHNTTEQRWALFWSSHPGLGLLLLAGAAALVFLSGYVVPRVSGWLSGDDPMAALAAIAAILTVAFFANTWWWKALSGWWTWAHTHGSSGGGASPLGQMQAGAAVIALIWFSAMGFGLASPTDYTGPGAAPLARAACPPDCGGGGGLDGPPGGGSQFRPPDMPAQQPDYQGGLNQAPLNQNSGISIYNENPAQGGQVPQQNMGPQMSGQRAAHGEPLPNYGPWQPDAQPPAQAPVQQAPQPVQQPVQQAPQPPQQPAQAPQNSAQAPQQQPGVQQPQGQPGQQPAQQPQTGQTQPGQQQPQNPASQQNPAQQQPQKQPDQTPQKQPDTPKKNPIDPTDLATAATRRGSQQAGQQAAQQGSQQATQQATQAAQQTAQQSAQQSTNQSAQQLPTDMNNKIGNIGDGIEKSSSQAAQNASVPQRAEPVRPPWGANQAQLNQGAERAAGNFETIAKSSKWLSRAGMAIDLMNGVNEGINQYQAGKPAIQAVVDVAPKTVGNIAGGWAGAAIGAEWGASAGLIVGGPVGAVVGAGIGAIAGGVVGSEFGEKAGELLSKGLDALFSW
ncbi:hypothetical protein DE4585_04737 [Mycobacteroides salmoniphilum]|uniref:Uncharacterized protein n=1 Tax=Mycobacteroides salmoniphilum TaxID=404941 RepID=A0A4R8RTF8_9MYCO|nr:hypothetical protein [Mycobacteroides salmoniphilum]TDZ77345.1 hypothetical protein DE4585_04737 [Mycobacteroides salmoniphilum]